MANILDYIDWRGDLSLSVAPLCEVDNLIFSKLAYLDLADILPPYGSGKTMTIGEVARQYQLMHAGEKVHLGVLVPPEIPGLLAAMGKSNRFRHLLLSDYVNDIDTTRQIQFSALTVFLGTDSMYIAFRGTDDTLIGWKENFNMSHIEAVPAQLEAVKYVNAVMERCPHSRVWLGGHSKGGNLAVYAAVKCQEKYKNRIVRVYNNDGPGFRQEMVESAAYREMDSRVCTIVPQNAVVGRLLEHNDHCRVIHSSANGLWQHNGFSWDVMGGAFVSEDTLTKESRMIEQSVKSWIATMNDEQREAFVDALYRLLTTTNAATLTELTSDRMWLLHLIRGSDPDSRKVVREGLTHLTGEAGKLWAETVLPIIKNINIVSKDKLFSKEKGAPGAEAADADRTENK